MTVFVAPQSALDMARSYSARFSAFSGVSGWMSSMTPTSRRMASESAAAANSSREKAYPVETVHTQAFARSPVRNSPVARSSTPFVKGSLSYCVSVSEMSTSMSRMLVSTTLRLRGHSMSLA
ncbi:PP71 [Orf virus]|uniref:PP71 n=1 Tax=Orf virus TaxID=10258 RepID=F1AX70_ORFV|nr:PP71 [Orf virus]